MLCTGLGNLDRALAALGGWSSVRVHLSGRPLCFGCFFFFPPLVAVWWFMYCTVSCPVPLSLVGAVGKENRATLKLGQ